MNWYIFAVISIISSSVSALYQKIVMKKDDSDPITSTILFQYLLALYSFAFALFIGFHPASLSLWPFFLLSGSLYAVGSLAFFRSIKLIEVSEMTVLAGFGVLFTILASFIFIHDRLTSQQLIGAILILCAVMLINYNKKTFKLNSGTWLALLGSASFGIAIVIDSYIIKQYDAVSYLPLSTMITACILSLRYIQKMPSVIRSVKRIDPNLLTYSLIYTISAITYFLALQYGALVSQMSAISRASIILTVIFAAIFLKEKKHVWKKIVAAILTTVGVLLVT